MKRSVVALMTMAIVLAVAGPAAAKGAMPQSARMTGPGLSTPMTFGDPTVPGGTSADGNVILLANETQLMQTLFEGDLLGAAPPQNNLGPRYTITWTMRRELHPGKTFQVRSELYPYAKGGAVMFTRGGQKVRDTGGGFVLRSGWAAPNPVVVDNLHALGMPNDHRRTAGKVASSSIAPVWAVLFVVGAMIVAAAIGAKRRRSPAGGM